MNFADMFYQSEHQSRVMGVFIGVVTNNQDPDKLGRIKVKFPKVSADNETDWIRVATLFTGAEFGSYFLPNVNDEVLVAFESGDINLPIVIGSLWNGVVKPPETNSDGKNSICMIKSKSGHTIKLDNTDGSEVIQIVDKTQKNMITIDSATNTIKVTSDADISIEAKNGAINLDAKEVNVTGSSAVAIVSKGDLDVKATGNANVKGKMINLN